MGHLPARCGLLHVLKGEMPAYGPRTVDTEVGRAGNRDDNKAELLTLSGIPLSNRYLSAYLSRKTHTENERILKQKGSC